MQEEKTTWLHCEMNSSLQLGISNKLCINNPLFCLLLDKTNLTLVHYSFRVKVSVGLHFCGCTFNGLFIVLANKYINRINIVRKILVIQNAFLLCRTISFVLVTTWLPGSLRSLFHATKNFCNSNLLPMFSSRSTLLTLGGCEWHRDLWQKYSNNWVITWIVPIFPSTTVLLVLEALYTLCCGMFFWTVILSFGALQFILMSLLPTVRYACWGEVTVETRSEWTLQKLSSACYTLLQNWLKFMEVMGLLLGLG